MRQTSRTIQNETTAKEKVFEKDPPRQRYSRAKDTGNKVLLEENVLSRVLEVDNLCNREMCKGNVAFCVVADVCRHRRLCSP
jgi:hypothetical protein